MRTSSEGSDLDPHLAPGVRRMLEQRYWRRIEAAATVDVFTADPAFGADPANHPALFADHGVVHVRDVARGALELAAVAAGVLIPERPPDRAAVVAGVAVAAAYLHDIGMVELSAARRRVHPQWAAQEVYRAEFDPVVAELLAGDHPMVQRIRRHGPRSADVETVVREVLAMSMVHSKSVVPARLLEDPAGLRSLVQAAVLADLDELVGEALPGAPRLGPSPALTHYREPDRSFAWLVSPDAEDRTFVADVLDGLRVLRAADALRQRGTVLRTSAGYEILLDARTADAVFALRIGPDEHTIHLAVDSPIAAGEAAVRWMGITPDGHLRLRVHGGRFPDDAVLEEAARRVANVVLDVEADVLPTFAGTSSGPGLGKRRRQPATMRIELAVGDDDLVLAHAVVRHVIARRPDLADRLVVEEEPLPAPLRDPREPARYAAGLPIAPASALAATLSERLGRLAGTAAPPEPHRAFDGVRLVHLCAGDVLIRAGTAAGHVYVPTGEGLVVSPLGGYEAAPVPPWGFLGASGVLREGERNADVRAVAPVDVVAIPGERFLGSWFRPLRPSELVERLDRRELVR